LTKLEYKFSPRIPAGEGAIQGPGYEEVEVEVKVEVEVGVKMEGNNSRKTVRFASLLLVLVFEDVL